MSEEYLEEVKRMILTAKMHSAGMNMPDPNARVWRYMRLEHLEDLLGNQRLHFARADNVNDNSEGRLPESIRQTLKALLPHIHRDGDQYSVEYLMEREATGLEQYKSAIFLSCWHLDDDETEERWRQDHPDREIAIQSTYLKLVLASFEKRRERFEVSAINYIDHEKDFVSPQHPFTLYVHKALKYKPEKELRAISYYPSQTMKEGIFIPIDIEALLEQIVISPNATEQIRSRVHALIGQYNLKIPTVDSRFKVR